MILFSKFDFCAGLVPEPEGEMAPPRENGGGSSRPQRVPCGESESRRQLQFSAADGPVALAAAPLRSAGLPEPSADRISQLPDVARRRGPQPAAGGPLALAHRHQHGARSSDHLHSRPPTQGQRARGEHHEGPADGLSANR